jgi:hypothetical protein
MKDAPYQISCSKEQFDQLKTDDRFAAGVGEPSGEMVFQLSEEVVINYLLQAKPTDNDHTLKQRYEKIIDETMEITGRFIEASERLMGELLRDMGFKAKRILFTEQNKGKEGPRSEI